MTRKDLLESEKLADSDLALLALIQHADWDRIQKERDDLQSKYDTDVKALQATIDALNAVVGGTTEGQKMILAKQRADCQAEIDALAKATEAKMAELKAIPDDPG